MIDPKLRANLPPQSGLIDARISTEVTAPLQQQRRHGFKIGSLGPHYGATLVLVICQGCLGGTETRVSARKGSGFAEISARQNNRKNSVHQYLFLFEVARCLLAKQS